VDVEFRVVADHKERLLLEMGQAAVRSGFSLLRQRLAERPDGVELTMLIRGPQAALLQLEEVLATHPRVHSFEALTRDGEITAPAPLSTASSTATNNHHPALNGHALNGSSAAPAGATVTEMPFNPRRVETMLPLLAREYPNVFPRLLALERELANGQRVQ